ncbi:MAG TPA: pyridoxal-phosphate dependent enzyme [Longimicrobium sp.]|nr:pyridoxal-phosphate dependent enzyme [Longimicrobium sp.]
MNTESGAVGAETAGVPSLAEVRDAARRLAGVARRTPLERSDALSAISGVDVRLKLEGMQRTGSFKLRGAYNFVARLSADELARGLVTASAGNHGQGVALAGRLLGARAVVFLPADTPENKQRRVVRHGAELRRVDGGYDEAHAAAEAFAAETGARYVHAFSDRDVLAGQGTVGLEIFEDLPDVRTLVVPVGGGGVIGGVGLVARALGDSVRVVGVQTHGTAAMHASLAAGRLTSAVYAPTICEGLTGDTDLPAFELARRVVDEIVLVSEEAVRRAIRWLYVEEGVVAEGSAAVAAAALLEGAVRGLEGPVAAVLTGSNLDASRLAQILTEA